MKNIFLILIVLNTMLMADFSRSAEGVVTDGATGLQWQDDYSDNGGVVKKATWIEAINYCENLSLDGGGWRLPNIRELNSIVDLSRNDAAIVPFFQSIESLFYWSATSYVARANNAWYIEFSIGERDFTDKSNVLDVRCVRSVQ